MGSREHAEVRVPRPRKKFVLLPISFLFSYNTIDRRKKKSLEKGFAAFTYFRSQIELAITVRNAHLCHVSKKGKSFGSPSLESYVRRRLS